ncbi:TSC22 domain family protein 1-like isoform X2 [Brienomyrus brachyistius]|nr:TSC22 domain family protein 1-like isoform X2 [Brienomyrus brachyistius]
MKKKSGFQITSVTPAQVSVSTNNSIAEDTESYDDLDESHTEDLSSSEILDVSLSRATDMGGPLRSSSEETLNNFHEAETPGAVSPNQPHLSSKPSHHLPQTHQQGTIVNGTVHHQHHHHHGQHHQVHVAQPVAAPPPAAASSGPSWTPEGGGISASATSTTGVLSSISQVIPATAGTGSITAPPLANIIPGMLSGTAGAPISGVNTLTSNVSNVSRLSSASTPVPGMTSTKSSSTGVAPGPVSGGTGIIGSGSKNINLVQKQAVTTTGSVAITTATLTGGSSAAGSGTHGLGQPTSSAPHSQAQQPAQVPAGSRFRVVKLDSSSESFRKGRWTCTDYYDKEAPSATVIAASATDTMLSHRPVESSVAVERESVVSEEALGPAAMQAFQPAQHQPSSQLQDYGTHPGLQPSHPSLAQSVAQPLGHPQDMVHPLLKTSAPLPVPASMGSIRPPAMVTPGSLPQAVVHSTSAVPPQQLPHVQAMPPVSAQGLPGVAQQMGYPPTQPAPTQAVHALPTSQGGGLPPEFSQHQPILQAPVVTQPLPPMPASLPPVAAAAPSGASPAMAAGQQPVVSLSASISQPLHQGLLPQQTSSVPVPQASQGAIATQMLPGAAQVAAQQLIQAQQIPPEPQQPAPTPAMASSQVAPTVPPSVPADSQSSLSQSSPPVPSGTRSSLLQGSQPPAGAQYISPPSVTATQLEDAQRLLFQHHSLLSLPKMAAGDASSEASASLGAEGSSGANALTASAGLFPLKSLPVDGEDDGSSGASVVAIDNKIEQAMDLVKSHLMYAVREEVEVLKEQIKELIERNSQLEQENNLLKNLASPEQLAQFQAQVQSSSSPPSAQQPGAATQQAAPSAQPASQSSGGSA